MIQCLLIKISTNARNLPVRSYHTLNAEEITFGRSAECTVHLADPRITMHHAVIKRLDNGQLHIISVNGELNVEETSQQSVPLEQGQKVMIGPYLLTIAPAPPDVALAASIELVQPLPDDYEAIKARTHNPLPNASSFKRKLSLCMAALIALIFIALPLGQNLIPKVRIAMAHMPFGFDRVWSPGQFSNAHKHFSSQCSNCHQVPTLRISDKACLKCHADVSPHVDDQSLQLRAFKTARLSTGGMRCAQCHREHKAPVSLTKQDNGMCIKCHGNIKAVNPNTTLSNIHDFDQDHPGFKVTLRSDKTPSGIVRIPQTDKQKLIEKSGLKFPHSQHVGLVQGPGGLRDVRNMSCTDCHRPEGKEMRFKPMTFKNDCMSCHSDLLKFNLADNNITLPHGEELSIANALRVAAPKQFAVNAEKVKTNNCSYCHAIQDQPSLNPKNNASMDAVNHMANNADGLPWKIVTPNINHDWFSKAHFNHALHRTQKCQSCHDVENSDTSEDIAMPNRQSCLQCHAGNKPKQKRITSGCMSCHDFHNAHKAKPATVANPVAPS